MKCDKLQRYSLDVDYEEQAFAVPDDKGNYMESSDVDAAIAELKEKLHDIDNRWNEQCKEIAQLKAENDQLKTKLENVQASAYADSVDAGMRERKLKRALWLMGARLGKMGSLAYHNIKAKLYFFDDVEGVNWASRKREQWESVETKCRTKAEEYK